MDKCISTFESSVNNCIWKYIVLRNDLFKSQEFFEGFMVYLYMRYISPKYSCSENCVLINFVFMSETLLQNLAVNNGLFMWSPLLYAQIYEIFCNGVQDRIPASSGKAVEFCCRQSLFFKKLQILLFWAGFSEEILMYLWI